jgi:hypothetical protein
MIEQEEPVGDQRLMPQAACDLLIALLRAQLHQALTRETLILVRRDEQPIARVNSTTGGGAKHHRAWPSDMGSTFTHGTAETTRTTKADNKFGPWSGSATRVYRDVRKYNS